MTEIIFTPKEEVHKVLEDELTRRVGPHKIQKNEYGKPYVPENPVYFNISHTRGCAAVAFSDAPVGLDIECLRRRTFDESLTDIIPYDEADEVETWRDAIIHYTAREAYVKLMGGSVFAMLKSLAYIGGRMYAEGVDQGVKLDVFDADGFVVTVCRPEPVAEEISFRNHYTP
ncbi:MAG: hypothetical protein LUD47_04950 [Clostridia bacterium]|nr:hypothetical protein [Clostridia bacterium]